MSLKLGGLLNYLRLSVIDPRMLSCTKCTHYLFCKSETNQARTSSWRTLQLFSHKDSWQSGRAKCANWVGDELRQGRWFPNRRWIGLGPCNDHSDKPSYSALGWTAHSAHTTAHSRSCVCSLKHCPILTSLLKLTMELLRSRRIAEEW